MRAWRTHEYGPPLAALRLDEVDVPQPGPGEVRVKVQAIPLNLNDLERITGGNMMVEPELPYSPGMEVMGVVEACGDGTGDWLGRRVVAMPKGANGGYAEYAVCPIVSTFDMPDSIPLPDAAALYFPFHLAWLGLFDRADLQPGESVLIHAGAGGSGSAAIQLAAHRGARVFATAGTDDKVDLCRKLGADVAINYTASDFVDVVLAETANRGVDVVFDNVGESVFAASLRCTAYNGRYLMMGFASNKQVADEAFVVPASGGARQHQALRRAARVRDRRHGRVGEDRHGLELRLRGTGLADHERRRRSRCAEAGPGGDRRGGRLRRHPGRDHGHGGAAHDRPNDRAPLIAFETRWSDCARAARRTQLSTAAFARERPFFAVGATERCSSSTAAHSASILPSSRRTSLSRFLDVPPDASAASCSAFTAR